MFKTTVACFLLASVSLFAPYSLPADPTPANPGARLSQSESTSNSVSKGVQKKARVNAPVFEKLHKGVNMDTCLPDKGVWPKIQHDAAQFQAAADAGFESVRVFMPSGADHKSTEQQIKDALSNDLR